MNPKSPFTIVCLGDSITCEWDEPKYPTYWQELLDKEYGHNKIKVISAGVNGETAQDGYYRLRPDVLVHKPDLVTIMFGHNDLGWGMPPELFNNYLRKIINQLNQHQIPHIWLLSPNQINDSNLAKQYPPYLQAIKAAAQEKNVPYINLWPLFDHQDLDQIFTFTFATSTRGANQPDYLHPNEKGHRLIANHLFHQLNQKKLL